MPASRLHALTRRAFLTRGSQLACTGVALPTALNLAAIGEAAAFDARDYKALVCVFMVGGNDHDNTVIPLDDASHARYLAARPSLAIPKAQLGGTMLQPATALPDGRRYAFNPAMGGLASLFNAGQAAVVLNLGPLVAPVTRQQYASADRARYPLPPKLFSHNDQTLVWQSQRPEGSTVGWGGRIGDLALASNATSLFTCISVEGQGVLLSGQQALSYRIARQGAIPILGVQAPVNGSTAVRDALRSLITAPRDGLLENEYARITARSITAEAQVRSATQGVQLTTRLPGSPVGGMLATVAKMIGGRQALGAARQVFMVQLGGFDNHGGLAGAHPRLIGDVSAAMTAFHAAMAELELGEQVTAFTASEFGRTLTSNGDGSDHGWGGHHLVVGGAVKGGRFYGTAPPVSAGNTDAPEDQWHVGQGRLLPTTSVDQFAATLARWFGVADSELDGILPNLRHFDTTLAGVAYPRTLGFL